VRTGIGEDVRRLGDLFRILGVNGNQNIAFLDSDFGALGFQFS
jgi:hypothetical protein